MFNLFPQKKSIKEILKESGLPAPSCSSNMYMYYTPNNEIPSYVQAQQDMIDGLLKDKKNLEDKNVRLIEDGTKVCVENAKLKEDNRNLEGVLKSIKKMVL